MTSPQSTYYYSSIYVDINGTECYEKSYSTFKFISEISDIRKKMSWPILDHMFIIL